MRPILALVSGGMAAALLSCSGPQLPVPAPQASAAPVASTPAAPECAEGTGDCDGEAGNACETPLTTNDEHCGACGTACGDGERCLSGGCRPASALALREGTGCAIVKGEVQCWGHDVFAASPEGAAPLTIPVNVKGIEDPVSVAVSTAGMCALSRSGRVTCWGKGKVEPVDGLSDAVTLGSAELQIFAVRANGDVQMVQIASRQPPELPALKDVVEIAGSSFHACALHAGGTVTCWGEMPWLGSGMRTDRMSDTRKRQLQREGLRVKGLKDAKRIVATDSGTCALRKDGRVTCWGPRAFHRGVVNVDNGPYDLPGIGNAVEMALGESHGCARLPTGKVVCAGSGGSGQLGLNDPDAPEGYVVGLDDAVAIGAGERVSCALRRSGALQCWGSASRGRLGNGALADYPAPVVVPGVTGATAFALGEGYSCALDPSQEIQCWGNVRAYQEVDLRGVPVRKVAPGTKYKALFPADPRVCAVDASGVLSCFHHTATAMEHRLTKLGKVSQVTMIGQMAAVVTGAGQLSLVDMRALPGPDGKGDVVKRTITGLNDVVSVAAASGVVCSARKSGKVVCAEVSLSRISAGTDPPRLAEIDGIKDAALVRASGDRMFVLHKDGAVRSFSVYEVMSGQTVTPSKGPIGLLRIAVADVPGAAGATALATEQLARCVLRKDASVACWGFGTDGQLGTGDYAARPEPAAIPGLTDVTALALGYAHGCATRRGGEVACWGLNSSDEIGQEARAYEFTPVAALKAR